MIQEWQCCFCGRKIDLKKENQVEIAVTYDDGGQQGLMAHEACLKKKLDPSVSVPIDD
mgnify:CR=1 FL=1